MSQIQPIETAPKDGRLITGVWLNADGSVADKAQVRWFEGDQCWTNGDYEITWFFDPSHWLPTQAEAAAGVRP